VDGALDAGGWAGGTDYGAVPMTEKFAIISLRVPLRLDYPWKVAQPEVVDVLEERLQDAIRWLDCVDGMASIKVTLVEREKKR